MRTRMRFYICMILLTLTFGYAKADKKSDSIRRLLPTLKGEKRIDAYYRLYDISSRCNNQKEERRCLQDYLNETIKQHNIEYEAKARYDLMCYYYNYSLKDSLIDKTPEELAFMHDNKCWEQYYQTWSLLIIMYIINEKNNTGLRQEKLMYEDATKRKNKYGVALALYGMGMAYDNLSFTSEAKKAYLRCINIMNHLNKIPTEILEVYSYYCDVLKKDKEYGKMISTTDTWMQTMQKLFKDGQIGNNDENFENSFWVCYYRVSRAQAELGLGHIKEAEVLLNKANKCAQIERGMVQTYVYETIIELYIKKKNYPKALAYIEEETKLFKGMNDMPGVLRILENKAQVMEALHQYKESSLMYKTLYLKQDSINEKDAKNQLNELNTLYRLDEITMQHQLSRNRYAIIFSISIILALIVFIFYRHLMTHRLKQKNEQLTIARDQAQESLRMKSDFIKNISHEIRTPLNILCGFTQIISDPTLKMSDEELQAANSQIITNTDRITLLINTMLELSECSSNNVIERNDKISCKMLCSISIERSKILSDKDIEFEYINDINPDVDIITNRTYATRAIRLLIHNAIKFTPHGKIILHSYIEDNKLNIAVTDNGPSIPPEEAEHIFEEFVQLNDYSEGVGIGLTVCRSIIRRLGGNVVLDTEFKDGCRFIITFPV